MLSKLIKISRSLTLLVFVALIVWSISSVAWQQWVAPTIFKAAKEELAYEEKLMYQEQAESSNAQESQTVDEPVAGGAPPPPSTVDNNNQKDNEIEAKPYMPLPPNDNNNVIHVDMGIFKISMKEDSSWTAILKILSLGLGMFMGIKTINFLFRWLSRFAPVPA